MMFINNVMYGQPSWVDDDIEPHGLPFPVYNMDSNQRIAGGKPTPHRYDRRSSLHSCVPCVGESSLFDDVTMALVHRQWISIMMT